MEMKPSIQGRHEGSTCREVRIVRPTLEASQGPDNSVILRVCDENNPAFWLDVMLTQQDLDRLQQLAIRGKEWQAGILEKLNG